MKTPSSPEVRNNISFPKYGCLFKIANIGARSVPSGRDPRLVEKFVRVTDDDEQ